jgi:hypothetical protein
MIRRAAAGGTLPGSKGRILDRSDHPGHPPNVLELLL